MQEHVSCVRASLGLAEVGRLGAGEEIGRASCRERV